MSVSYVTDDLESKRDTRWYVVEENIKIPSLRKIVERKKSTKNGKYNLILKTQEVWMLYDLLSAYLRFILRSNVDFLGTSSDDIMGWKLFRTRELNIKVRLHETIVKQIRDDMQDECMDCFYKKHPKMMCELLRDSQTYHSNYYQCKCLSSCHFAFVEVEYELYKRDIFDGPTKQCDGCSVTIGSAHHVGCLNEICPKCRIQSVLCGHIPNLELIYIIKPNDFGGLSLVDQGIIGQGNPGFEDYEEDSFVRYIQNGKEFCWTDDGNDTKTYV
jgi:hypothetical protein